MISSNYE